MYAHSLRKKNQRTESGGETVVLSLFTATLKTSMAKGTGIIQKHMFEIGPELDSNSK